MPEWTPIGLAHRLGQNPNGIVRGQWANGGREHGFRLVSVCHRFVELFVSKTKAVSVEWWDVEWMGASGD